jgi:Bacteriocin-protection, YdeI or OmpD-Associated/Domain of unknown function (DUF1905)
MNQAPPQDGAVIFRAAILLADKTATGIRVPDEAVAELKAGSRPRIHATVNGYTYRSTVAPLRGSFMLPVSAEIRTKAHLAGGDEVEVALRPDTKPRNVTIPPDFARALAQNPPAQDFFNALSSSSKQRFVLSIEGAKADEARQRRIAKAVAALREKRT